MVKRFLLSAGIALGLLFGINIASVQATETQMTAQQVVDEMQIGWNLGNSLDAYNYSKGFYPESEEEWNNPKTTKKMIDTIADAGFRSIRIPVTYYNHLDANKQIDSAWLDRVEEVVHYALDNDLYVIINVHHDTGHKGWIRSEVATYETDSTELTNLWTQIATRFKDYDHRLLFEGTNEILNADQNWDHETSWDDFRITHDLNQDFITTVRNTGGNNSDRFLVLSTWAASWNNSQIEELFYTNFQDTVSDRLILNVHSYDTETDTINYHMKKLNYYSELYNIPVIIDEFGTKNEIAEEDRVAVANHFVTTAKQYGIACFVWDNGSGYGLLDRNKCCFIYPNIVETMITAAGGIYTPQSFDNMDNLSFSNTNNWKQGCYDSTNGNYQNANGGVCLRDYVTLGKEIYTFTAPANYILSITEFSPRGEVLRTSNLTNEDDYTLSDDASFISISLHHAQDKTISYEAYQTLLANGEITLKKESNSGWFSSITSSDTNVWFTDSQVPVTNYSQIRVMGKIKTNAYFDILTAANGAYVFRMEKNNGLFRRVGWWDNKVADASATSHIDLTQHGTKTYTIVDDVHYEENLIPGSTFHAKGIQINLSQFEFEGASITDENGILLRDYVPAMNEQGQVCIYEKVSGTYLSLPDKHYTSK